MAEQAAKEPTMEEILASIRRIISEDGEPGEETAEAAAPPADDVLSLEDDLGETFESIDLPSEASAADDSEHLLSVDDLLGDDMDFSEIEGLSDLEEAAPEPQVELTSATVTKTPFDDLNELEEIVSTQPEAAPAPPAEPEPQPRMPEFTAETAPQREPIAEVAPAPQSEAREAEMVQRRYQDITLTGEETANAAAGSLGKLISTLDLSGDNTIEGLVREMLKPMIKEWLDDNLPGIVERKVEAEVQRISKMVS